MATLTEMEQEALSEIGNIILTGFLSSIADTLQIEIPTELPVFSHGCVEDLFLEILVIRFHMSCSWIQKSGLNIKISMDIFILLWIVIQ